MQGMYIFGVLYVDIFLPAAANEGWRIWFEFPNCNNMYKACVVVIMITQSCNLCGSILSISQLFQMWCAMVKW